jgi:hypothetical protein
MAACGVRTAVVGRYVKLCIAATMHRSQLGIGDRTKVAECRACLPDDGPPSTLLDIVFGCHAERRCSLNATKFVRTIPGAVTRIVSVRATHQPACPASERVVKSPMYEPMALSLLCAWVRYERATFTSLLCKVPFTHVSKIDRVSRGFYDGLRIVSICA